MSYELRADLCRRGGWLPNNIARFKAHDGGLRFFSNLWCIHRLKIQKPRKVKLSGARIELATFGL